MLAFTKDFAASLHTFCAADRAYYFSRARWNVIGAIERRII
jgi:hypothetical protein